MAIAWCKRLAQAIVGPFGADAHAADPGPLEDDRPAADAVAKPETDPYHTLELKCIQGDPATPRDSPRG